VPRSAPSKDLAIVLLKCSRSCGVSGERRLLSSALTFGLERGHCGGGVGRRHAQRTPVIWHRRSLDKAAALRPVYRACERGSFYTNATCQLGHSPGRSARMHRSLAWTGVRLWRSETRA
jgi:hypothetical protein